jgi:hypothetical protein
MSDHWQAFQGRAGGQVSIQPQRLPYFMRVKIGRFSTDKLKDRSVSAASEADILQKRDILGRLSIEELEDKLV